LPSFILVHLCPDKSFGSGSAARRTRLTLLSIPC
jgi:hypothetical protein